MLRCGLKLTHDGGVAVTDGGRLLFAYEAEKLANYARHAPIDDLCVVETILAQEGIAPEDIGVFVVDGWGADAVSTGVRVTSHARSVQVRTAPYRQADDGAPALHRYRPVGDLRIGGHARPYASFRHAEGHAAGAYLTSPAAAEGRPALVLVWDGGTFPELYRAAPGSMEHLGAVLTLRGEVYSGFVTQFEPFRPASGLDAKGLHDFHLSVPGKAMAYAGLATPDVALASVMRDCLAEALRAADAARAFNAAYLRRMRERPASSEVAIATFQAFLGDTLVASLDAAFRNLRDRPRDLCVSGGCGLNIKWNSALRASSLFDSVWVPPFPNDSGSAIGAVCAELLASGHKQLDWSVFCGPPLRPSQPPAGWAGEPCSLWDLARVLDETGDPVVVLHGRAEAGPRALGHRSILADPRGPQMKARLNEIKRREGYRPVAPICLERAATDIFAPGGPDPHMLFDHRVREAWVSRIPAVLHVDGTARLQTMSARDCPDTAELLEAFHDRTGVPVLCNTSANHHGRGFFPDAESAMAWGGADRVWADGTLYGRRPGAPARASGLSHSGRDADGGSR